MNPYTDRLERLSYEEVREFLSEINCETHRLEFKEKGVGRDEVAYYATAFANADGGLIVLGFKDPKLHRGTPLTNGDTIDISDNNQRGYVSVINAKVYPPLPVEIQGYRSNDGGHAFMVIRVAHSLTAPHEYLASDNGRFNLPVRRDTQLSGLRLSEIEALRLRREPLQTESPIPNQQFLPISLQLQGTNPDFIFGLDIRPQIYQSTARVLDSADDAFFQSLEIATRKHGDGRVHDELTVEPSTDGVVFSSGKRSEMHVSGTSQQPFHQIYIGSDGRIIVRFQQSSSNITWQILSTWVLAYRLAQSIFYRFGIAPNAHVYFVMRLNSDRQKERPVFIGSYEHNSLVNFATQSFADAFTDTMLRLYRASALSESREDTVEHLTRFAARDPEVENQRQRWLL